MSTYYNTYWRELQNQTLDDFHYKWPAIKHLIPTQPDMTILDFGCGTGDILEQIIRLNPKAKYYGIDVSEVALKIARKRFPKARFFVATDGDKLPLKTASVDYITALDVIEHIYNTKETIRELVRVLKPGGKLLMTTPYHGIVKNLIIISFFFEQYFNPQGPHIRFYSKKSLLRELEREGFLVEEFGYFGRFFPVSRAMYALVKK